MRVVGRISVLVGVALAAGAGSGFGQVGTASGPATARAGSGEAVRVAESVEAREALDRIATMEAQGRYVQANWDYLRLLADHGDAVVRTPDGTYAGVTPLALRRIEGWPADAKALCRDLLESRAAAAMEELGESADPARVMIEAQRWWLTKSASEAALRAARRLAESGCVETADWILGRLADAHPELAGAIRQVKNLRVNPRSTSAPSTRPSRAASRPIAQSAPVETILWSIESVGETPTTGSAAGESSEASAFLIGATEVRPRALKTDRLPATGRPVAVPGEAGPTRVSGGTLSRPVIEGDRGFVQNASCLWCLRLYSGYVEWTAGREGAAVNAGARPFDPAVGEGWVFAVLPEPAPATATTQPAETERVLMGIVADGRPRLRLSPARALLESESTVEAFIRSSPLWYEGGLYVVAGERTGTIEDLYLLRLEPQTGKVAWRRHLSSLTAGKVQAAGPRCELTARRGLIRVRGPGGLDAMLVALTGDVERIAIAEATPASQPTPADKGYTAEANGVIVRCADGRISAVVHGTDAAAVLERRVSENPGDCSRRLDLARWAIRRAGPAKRAAAEMRETLACLETVQPQPGAGQEPSPVGPRWSVRRQVLELAIDHADTAAISDDLLAIAAKAAESPEEEIRYRLRFAAARERQKRWPEAIELLQDILDNDAASRQEIDGRRAGRTAAEAIAEVMRTQGRPEYEAVEEMAAAALAEGGSDVRKLEEVCQKYPNSRAAAKARLELARSTRQSNQPRRAIRYLTDGAIYADEEDRPAIGAQIAECYFELGDATRGLAELARGAKEFGETPITFAGRQTTFSDTLDAWRSNAATIPRPLPTLSEPIGPGFTRTFERPFLLLAPPDADDGPVVRRFDMVLAQTGDAILAVDPSSGKIQWRAAWEGERAPVWLADDDETLVLTTPTRVLALDRGTGRERWRWELSSEESKHLDEALIDPEFLDAITAEAANDTMLVAASRSGRVQAMRLSDGQRLWRRQVAGPPIGTIGFGRSEVVCLRAVDGRPEAIVLDATDGRELARSTLEHGGRLTAPMAAADGTVIVADSREAVGYKPRTLKVLWRWRSPEGTAAAGVHVSGGHVYVYGVGFVAALAPDGRPRWQAEGFGPGPRPIRSVRAAGGQGYVAGDDFITAMDAGSGTIRRQVALKEGETIEAWTLTPRYVAAVVSRPTTGGPAGPRALEAMFVPRSVGENGPVAAETRVLLSESIPIRKAVLCDGAVVVQAGKRLMSWRGPATATAPSQPSR